MNRDSQDVKANIEYYKKEILQQFDEYTKLKMQKATKEEIQAKREEWLQTKELLEVLLKYSSIGEKASNSFS